MRSKEEIIESQAKLAPSQIDDLNWSKDELAYLIESESVSEEGLLRFENLVSSLQTIKRLYTSRVISLLKQGHRLD